MLYSNSRVAFSRPQLVYRTPSSYFPDMGEGKVSLGFTSEILDFEVPSSSSSAFFNTKLNNWNFLILTSARVLFAARPSPPPGCYSKIQRPCPDPAWRKSRRAITEKRKTQYNTPCQLINRLDSKRGAAGQIPRKEAVAWPAGSLLRPRSAFSGSDRLARSV